MEIGEIERETKSEKLFYSFFFVFLLDRSTSISGGPGFLWVQFLLLVSFFSVAIPPVSICALLSYMLTFFLLSVTAFLITLCACNSCVFFIRLELFSNVAVSFYLFIFIALFFIAGTFFF